MTLINNPSLIADRRPGPIGWRSFIDRRTLAQTQLHHRRLFAPQAPFQDEFVVAARFHDDAEVENTVDNVIRWGE